MLDIDATTTLIIDLLEYHDFVVIPSSCYNCHAKCKHAFNINNTHEVWQIYPHECLG